MEEEEQGSFREKITKKNSLFFWKKILFLKKNQSA